MHSQIRDCMKALRFNSAKVLHQSNIVFEKDMHQSKIEFERESEKLKSKQVSRSFKSIYQNLMFGKSKEALNKLICYNKNYNMTVKNYNMAVKKICKFMENSFKLVLVQSYNLLRENWQEEKTVISKKRECFRTLVKNTNYILQSAFSKIALFIVNSQEIENKNNSDTVLFTEKLENLVKYKIMTHFNKIKQFASLETYRLYLLSLVRWKFANLEGKHHTAKQKCFHLINMNNILENYIQN